MRSGLILAVALIPAAALAAPPAYGPGAVWTPTAAQEAALRDACVAQPVPDVRVCLLRFMAASGASAEALEFTRVLEDDGWMTAFTPRGRVSVAEVLRPFRANANAGIILVNGDPPLVDVSSPTPLAPFADDERVAAVRRADPGASIWAADPDKPDVVQRPGGGQRFLFDFPLRVCHACADLAVAQVAFDFNGDGRFLGTHLLTVSPSALFSVEGEVRRGDTFEARVDALRTFRLKPFSEGWTIELKDKDGNDYCSVVTAPYRGTNALTIFGNSPGVTRQFRCVAKRSLQAEADKALREVLWTDNATWKETDAAAAAHARAEAEAERATFTIVHLELGNQVPGQRPWIDSMTFRFELRPHGPATP
ncbi:MAG: hypothetical protein KGJ84_14840 [Elusimicrobia bacterium]|nr:hypothetical protein [Elusimicrobiota bacterium]